MKYKLGQLVEQYDEINDKGEFQNLESLQGINSLKYFQECKSNKNDIDLFRYRICRKGMFAYNRATSRNGERISIAYRTGNDCLISPSYYCFSIKDENALLPEYLDIWFKRPIFDRYARFNSWGSATEFFTFEDFCETEIDLPSIEEQRKIVHDYKVITDRIELLKKINSYYRELANITFNDWRKDLNNAVEKKLSEVASFYSGYSYQGDELKPSNIAMATIKNYEKWDGFKTDGFKEIVPGLRIKDTQFAKKFDILVAHTDLTQDRTIIGNSEMILDEGNYTKLIFSMDLVKLIEKNNFPHFLLYCYVKDTSFKKHCGGYVNGTTVMHLSKNALEDFNVKIPRDLSDCIMIEAKLKTIFSNISNNIVEINILSSLTNSILTNLSKEVA